MISLLFVIGLFCFWLVIGLAVLVASRSRVGVVQMVLVSPAVGLATTIVPVFALSRLGMPVGDFGRPLLISLASIAVAVLVIARPRLSVRRFAPHAAMLLIALLLAGRPLLQYGFDWVSFANDDMANYSLAAERFLHGGYFQPPNLPDLFSGRDYSQSYWYMHVESGVRAGSELTLAAIWAATGLNAHKIFMPLIMALHLALVSASAAVVARRGMPRRAPLWLMGLIAISPMATLGALYQLIGQVGGLALLAATVALLYRKVPQGRPNRIASVVFPTAVVLGALFIWYPEVVPFLGLSWLLFFGISYARNPAVAARALLTVVLLGSLTLLFLNQYLIDAVLFMARQATGGMRQVDPTSGEFLFPFFLVPTGIPAVWGVIPIASALKEPLVSASILVGITISAWLVIRVLPSRLREADPSACVLAVMLLMAVLLFTRGNGFGLFKLAMFIQPWLWGTIAVHFSMLKAGDRPIAAKIGGVALMLIMLASQHGYVRQSTGEILGGFSELPNASESGINRQFEALIGSRHIGGGDGLVSDTANIVLAKFQAFYSRGQTLLLPSRDFFEGAAYNSKSYHDNRREFFVEHEVPTRAGPNRFSMVQDPMSAFEARPMVTTAEPQTVFNAPPSGKGSSYFEVIEKPRDHLMFIHSDKGHHYYLGYRDRIAYFQLEADPMFAGRRMSGFGEHILFMALAPSAQPRLLIELTSTVLKQFESALPQPLLQGIPLPFIGRGSGRVISEPINFSVLDNASYLSIDMGREARGFSDPATGLMSLYGRDIASDQRRITAFGREISLVSEIEYSSMQRPSSLSRFPDDLGDRNLEYSGMYEDGWISERAFFVLASRPLHERLALRGSVPQLHDANFTSEIVVSLDGVEVRRARVAVGSFELVIPVPRAGGKRRVDLAFINHQVLPGSDGRVTGGQIKFLGFE